MRFVLVHSPLVGPLSWGSVAKALEQQGHEIVVPSLAPAAQSKGFVWEAQVRAAARAVSDSQVKHPVWLVGHSGAGPLLPAIGAAVTVPVAGYVFVDAGLPHAGMSRLQALPVEFADRLRSLATDGWLPPWNEWLGPGAIDDLFTDPDLRAAFTEDLPRLPLRMFDEELPDVSGWEESRCAFVKLSDAYSLEADRAVERGWPVVHLHGDHLWPVTHPGVVAGAVLASAKQAGKDGG